jgi:nickel/cobalt transporter (NicO) family protein
MRTLALFAAAVGLLAAHPMGNFSVSHYMRLEVSGAGVEVSYVLDLAEVPAYALLRDWKLYAGSPQPELEARAAEQARQWAQGLEFQAAGHPVEPKFVRAEIKLRKGADGLSVVRIASVFELNGVKSPLRFEDHNFPERAGWKEIVIRSGAGASVVKASHDAIERSKALTEYPADPTSAPPQDLRAFVEWKLTNPAVSKSIKPVIAPIPQPPPVEAPAAVPPLQTAPFGRGSESGTKQPPGTAVKGDYLSRLVSMQRIPVGWLLAGLFVAFGFGAAHALTPGHGKTIVAAYLVGSRGTMGHAAFLGGMVTFTHTITVFLLGLGVLFLSDLVKPEKITPVLGAISGLSIVAVGGSLFYRRLMRLRAAHDHHHSHDHSHAQPHDHHHPHDHGHDDHDHAHPALTGGAEVRQAPCLADEGGVQGARFFEIVAEKSFQIFGV